MRYFNRFTSYCQWKSHSFPLTERNGAERQREKKRGTCRAGKERKNTAYGDERTTKGIHLHRKIEVLKMYVGKICTAFCLYY